MILESSPKFRKVIKILDAINPYVVFVSIIGLIIEFTYLKNYVLFFNSIIDVFFVFDFLLRLAGYKEKKQYFFRGYGWVDLLAAIPGLTFLFEQVPGLFKIFKILRIGRFFKIVRILRFLRIFSFLKKMKGDSPFIQERIMKIGVVIVLTLVVSIGFVDLFMDKAYVRQKQSVIQNLQNNNFRVSRALKLVFPSGIICYKEGNSYRSQDDVAIKPEQCDSHDTKLTKQFPDLLEVGFDGNESYVLLEDKSYLSNKNNVMLSMILGLIALICIVIFYIGFILAKDIKIVNLIVDSIDADDYMLLINEGQNYMDDDGEFRIHKEEEEIYSLFKMVNKLIIDKNLDGGMMAGGFGGGEMDLGMSFRDLPDSSLEMDGGQSAYEGGGANLSDIREIIQQENAMLKEELSSLVTGGSASSGNLGFDDPLAMTDPTVGGGADFNLADIKEAIRGLNDEMKDDLLYELMQKLEQSQKDVAINAIKLTSKGIVNYLNKNIKE